MGRDNSKEKIKYVYEIFDNFFKNVTEDNFFKLNDEFLSLIMTQNKNFTRREMLVIIFEYSNNKKVNEFQREILIEIEARLHGYCSPAKDVNWEEE